MSTTTSLDKSISLTRIFLDYKVTVSLFVFFTLLYSGSSLQCYHCLERPKSTEKHLSCAYFDKSSKFHKECTHSTFCMKRTSLYQLHNGSYITIHVHRCADQAHRTMVQDANGDWNWANLLRFDLYNEGCFPHNNPSRLTTDTSHCFCSSDFCNSSSLKQPSIVLISTLIIYAFSLIFVIPLNIFVIR